MILRSGNFALQPLCEDCHAHLERTFAARGRRPPPPPCLRLL